MNDNVLSLFQALADTQRIKILAQIVDRPASVDSIADRSGLPLKVVHRHLARLREVGIVERQERGGNAIYRFRQQPLTDALRDALAAPRHRPELSGDLDDFDRKVLGNYLQDGKLKEIPSQHKKRGVILRWLAERFETERMYEEREVNAILAEVHPDVASLRRYMVDDGILERQVVRVIDAAALLGGKPEVQHRISYWKRNVQSSSAAP